MKAIAEFDPACRGRILLGLALLHARRTLDLVNTLEKQIELFLGRELPSNEKLGLHNLSDFPRAVLLDVKILAKSLRLPPVVYYRRLTLLSS